MKKVRKSIFKSKTFWGAVISFLVTLYETVAVPMFGWPHLPKEFYAVLGALGFSVTVYGRAKADTPVGLTDAYAPSEAEKDMAKQRAMRR